MDAAGRRGGRRTASSRKRKRGWCRGWRWNGDAEERAVGCGGRDGGGKRRGGAEEQRFQPRRSVTRGLRGAEVKVGTAARRGGRGGRGGEGAGEEAVPSLERDESEEKRVPPPPPPQPPRGQRRRDQWTCAGVPRHHGDLLATSRNKMATAPPRLAERWRQGHVPPCLTPNRRGLISKPSLLTTREGTLGIQGRGGRDLGTMNLFHSMTSTSLKRAW